MDSQGQRNLGGRQVLVLLGLAAVVLVAIAIVDSGDLWPAAFLVAAVLGGFLVGRWWALAVPAVLFLGLLAVSLAGDSCDAGEDCYEEITPLAGAFILGLFLAITEIAMAVGIVLRQLLQRGATHRT